MLAWDQAPHWGKREKKGPWAKNRGKRVTPPFPPSPGHRSPIFFLFDPVFCLFPLLRSLVPRYIHASHCDYIVPFFFNLYNRPFPSFHSPFFLKLSKQNGANHFIFRPEFPVSLVNVNYPGSLVDRSHV